MFKEIYGFSPLAVIKTQRPIESIIPGDFNYDGWLDILIIFSDENGIELQYFYRQCVDQNLPLFGIEECLNI